MKPVSNWFERKFEFSFPADLYPNLCTRLRGTPARLEELVRGCPREPLTHRPQGKWSIQEHAGHVLDLEPLWRARLEDYLTASGQLTVADLSNRKTHEANHNAHDLQEILGQFRKARLQLTDRVQELAPEVFSRTLLHPRLQQPMRLVDHLYFVAEHDDHHLGRIWELIAEG
jgi:uncharacterized damage-inducible protein DinB